jgi:carotenoid cleavage dioxygenase
VFLHAGKLLTSGEIGFPYHVRPTDLSTVGVYDFAGRLTTSMTAHPKIDPETGRMHFFGYGFTEPFLTYHVADATGRLMSSQQIDVAGPTMIHDFAITDRDAIFWEFPVVFSMDMAIAGERFPYKWDPSYGARIGVMPLGGPTSAIRWVEVPPAYVFHGVNAHRDGDDVVVDVAQYHEMFEHGPLGSAPKLHRWHLRTGGTSLTIDDEVLEGERRLELPTRDPRRVGRANRYGWFLEVTDPATPDGPPEFHGLARRDFQTGTLDRWDPGPAIAAGEGLFVPDGDDAGESDGWLLTYTYDRAEATGAFVVLRADDVAAGPVATVGLPQRVPYGFHATWVPAATGLLT